MKGYRFVTDDLTSEHGNIKWKIGKWQKLENDEPLELCSNGFHASQKPIDSINYVFGSRWFICEAKGEILKDTDKFCAREMRIVREIPKRVIQEFAIDCAYHVLHIFENQYPKDKRPRLAIEAARQYLKYPTQEKLDKLHAAGDAAWDAARAAAWAAAGAADWAAAGDAARAAAGDAAWAAAGAAARAAAGAAERKWQNRHLLNLIRRGRDDSRE